MFYNYQLHLTVQNLFEFVLYDNYQIINSDKKKKKSCLEQYSV
jgi:hypothetical protein